MTTTPGTTETTGTEAASGLISRIAGACARAPKLVLVVAGVAFLIFGALGGLVSERLSAGGFLDPDAESSRVADLLAAEHGVANMQLIFAVRDPGGVTGERARGTAREIAATLDADQRVSTVTSWTDPIGATLVSRDGTTGLVVAGLVADDNEVQKIARELADQLTGERDGVTVLAGGQAMAFEEINSTAEADLLLAEGIAVPITFLLLVLFLRSVVAAAVPVIAGVLAIVGTTGVLFVITFLTELSVFALNVTTALGLALAIDYSLLLIGRYREEISRGLPHEKALSAAMHHGGRAVVFSGVIVATALIGLWLFPITFLRSIGYAGVAVVALSVLLALTCVPALLALLGPRMNRKPQREALPVEQTRLYRIARAVQKRPLLTALPVLAVLLLAGSPVLDLRLGLPDDRVLSTEAQSRQVGDLIREGFDQNMTGTIDIVLTDAPADRLGDYAARLSAVADVTAVAGPTGTFVDGAPAGPPVGSVGASGSAHLAVATDIDPYSDEGAALVETLRAVDAPGVVRVGGLAQQSADTAAGISGGLVAAILWIAVTSALLLFLLTGSLLLPLKALVLNTLSLAATFGALVWIFQEGHVDGLGTTATGFTVATVPVLLFCVAFGLSMDYEVFLLARFTEEWERSEHTRADVDTAVAVGLARSGRVVTAAALLMAVVFLGIATSEVALMRALGVGLALAVIVDATLVRTVLVPAAMRIAGKANWWTPRWMAPVVERVRIRE
ncbi:MMPL family transporter [Nocardia higoensis]|uniref:MMPL family transporter n=1 Tax=Nocardia higoensis TaxID=228599 RepID=UPI000302871F|nr:efflux RND transporter permease subunit [Nocardia higoensis]